MIIKDKKIKNSKYKNIQQGEEAEKQMAFYLKRAFSENKDVFVFNDVKFEYKGEIAQIDHLILTYYGFILIESKSCVGQLSYDNHDQWIRNYINKKEGMPSPIQQTKRQYQILKNILNENAHNLIGKFMFLQKKFGAASIDIIVSIADKTILEHPEKRDENILKSDQVCDRISSILKLNKKNNIKTKFLLSKTEEIVFKFKDEEINKIIKFIKENDINKYKIEKKVLDSIENKIKEPILNNNCEHENKINYGKFGYYFKCSICEKNTKIKEFCNCCKSKNTKIRKEKDNFFIVCKDCDKEYFYFKNS